MLAKTPLTELPRKNTLKQMMAGKGTPFTPEEYRSVFREEGEAGQVPDRDSEDYLPYIERVLLARQKVLEETMKDKSIKEVENKLRRFSVSRQRRLPAARPWQVPVSYPAQVRIMWGDSSQSPAQQLYVNQQLSSLPDLGKWRPEFFCSTPKSYDKLTFRELICGCTKVMMYLPAYDDQRGNHLKRGNHLYMTLITGIWRYAGCGTAGTVRVATASMVCVAFLLNLYMSISRLA